MSISKPKWCPALHERTHRISRRSVPGRHDIVLSSENDVIRIVDVAVDLEQERLAALNATLELYRRPRVHGYGRRLFPALLDQ